MKDDSVEHPDHEQADGENPQIFGSTWQWFKLTDDIKEFFALKVWIRQNRLGRPKKDHHCNDAMNQFPHHQSGRCSF